MGVVSNAQFFTPLLVEALLGAPPEALGLETALSSYSFALGFAKPDLRLFEAVVRVLKDEGISPGEILFVGNSAENDVAPAQELGLLTSLFAGDCRSYRPAGPGKAGSSPDLVVTSLEELPEKILL
jgi:putative hydrolase of the HAD superfamily